MSLILDLNNIFLEVLNTSYIYQITNKVHFVKGLVNYTKYDPNKQEGAISTYQVANEIEIDDDDDTKEVTFHVYFNEDELEIQCNCCLFEFRGILYRHAFSVLIMIKRIKILPSKYILPRWSKDFK